MFLQWNASIMDGLHADRNHALDTDNPLLNQNDIPLFGEIHAEHVQPALGRIIADNRAAIEALVEQSVADWEHFVQPFEDLDERLSRMWDAASHLNSVLDDEAFRDAYRDAMQQVRHTGRLVRFPSGGIPPPGLGLAAR